MNKKYKIFYFLSFFLILSNISFLSGQTFIRVEDIPALVRSNSFFLRAKKQELYLQKISLYRPVFDLLPDLKFEYSGGWTEPVISSDGWAHRFNLSTSWPFLANATRIYTYRIQLALLKSEEINYDLNEQSEFLNAINLYWDAIRTTLLYETAVSNEVVSKTRLEFVELQKSVGKASEQQVLTANADYDNALYNTASSLAERDLVFFKLGLLIGLTNFELDKNKWENFLSEEKIENVDVEKLPQIVLKKNEIQILRLQREDSFRQRILPSIYASFTMDWWERKYAYKNWTSDQFTPAFSVGISYPIFEKNKTLDEIRMLDLKIKKAENELTEIIKNKTTEFKSLQKEYESKYKLMKVSEHRLLSAELVTSSMRESYRLGITSLVDLLQTEKDLRELKRDLVLLKIELVKLRSQLGYLVGDVFKYLK